MLVKETQKQGLKFRARTEEELHFGRPPDTQLMPDAWRFLPRSVVDNIPLRIERGAQVGRPSLLLPVLACLAYWSHKNQSEGCLRYHNGLEVTIPAEGFVISDRKIALTLWNRWYGLDESANGFKKIHSRVISASKKLQKDGTIHHIPSKLDKSRGSLGRIRRLDQSVREAVFQTSPSVTPAGVCLSVFRETMFWQGDWFNAVDAVGAMFAEDSNRVSLFDTATHTRDIFKPRSVMFNDEVQKRWREGKSRGHLSCAMQTTASLHRGHVFFPWIIFDIDSDTFHDRDGVDIVGLEEPFRITRDILKGLLLLGVPLKEIYVAYTGKSGFHIHLPSGLLGNPIFLNDEKAKKVLTAFASIITSHDVDPNLFAANHLYCETGTKRKATGLYKRHYKANKFLEMSLQAIVESSLKRSRARIVDPRNATPNDALTSVFQRSINSLWKPYPRIPVKTDSKGASPIVKEALKGCRESQEWYAGKKGRNSLLYTIAVDAANRMGLSKAQILEHLRLVNDRCTPPVDEQELMTIYKSATKPQMRSSKRNLRPSAQSSLAQNALVQKSTK